MRNEKQLLIALGGEIKRARKAKGLTQEQLAEVCGWDPTYISLLERGLRNPPFLSLCALARETGYPLKHLLENIK